MKSLVFAILVLCTSAVFAQESEFLLGFPSVTETNKLTAAMFNDADAVILHEEQGYNEGPHSRFDGFTIYLTNEVTVTSREIVAKVFNAAGVEHFGSFEYEYATSRDRDLKHKFTVHARILKPDSTIWVMPDSAVSRVVGSTTGSGRPLTEKVLFKLYTLAPGDIVQIEYTDYAPFSFLRQVLFWYHDIYPALTSVVTVQIPNTEKLDYLSFPSDMVGEPAISEARGFTRRTWVVKNLAALPREAMSRPFTDISYLTAIVKHTEPGEGWRTIAKDFIRYCVEPGSVPKSFMEEIGLDPSLKNATLSDVDRAYTALRKYFRLHRSNVLFPETDNVSDLIEAKEGDASDLAYLMIKILDRWDVPAVPVLLRDRRKGSYEQSVASYAWFDRLGVMVTVEGVSNIFDFDRGVPNQFEYPWYLNDSRAVALYDTGVAHLAIQTPQRLRDHYSEEHHVITLQRNQPPQDSVQFVLRGAMAERLRESLYPLKGKDLETRIRTLLAEHALVEADTATINDFLNAPEISVRGSGTSRAAETEIDSFLTFQPKNHLLRALRDKFASVKRYDDIYLDEQCVYSFEWSITVPPGYRCPALPQEESIATFPGFAAQVTYFNTGDGLYKEKADILMKKDSIKADKYRDWLAFLDATTKAIEREIMFQRR